MSCAPVSTSPVPSPRSAARALAWNISAGKIAVPTPQPTSMPCVVAHLTGRQRAPGPAEALGALARSIRAGPSRRRACPRSARPRHSSSAGIPAGPCRRLPPPRRSRISSAAEPVASPGARIGAGRAGVVTRTPSWEVAMAGAGVERVRGAGGRLEEIVEGAGRRHRVVRERGQPAFFVHPEAQASGGSARGGRRGRTSVRGVATSFTGRPSMPRRHDAEHLRRGDDRPWSRSRRRETGCGSGHSPAECRREPQAAFVPWQGPGSACRE